MMKILEATKYIEYNPYTGEIKRIGRKNSNGSIDHYGYLILKIRGRQWKAHRLAWTKFYNRPPQNNIDHIDGNKTNNRILNLRDVKQKYNVKNTIRKPNKKTGIVGIYEDNQTKGLLAKYTTRFKGKTHRFRDLPSAILFRKERGLQI